jgi:hypothetical protein
LLLALLVYTAMCGYLFIFQHSILYKPTNTYAAPDPTALPTVREVEFMTEDGITLHSWFSSATTDKPTVLFLHGNADSLQRRTPTYQTILKAGYGLLALEYRGYSGNAGRPSEQGLYKDARAALAYLQNQGISSENVVVMGYSLGTGVAVQMATEYTLAAVALLAPYASITAIASDLYWYVPVNLLLQDRFDSLSKAAQVDDPVLIFHGEQDTLIPVEHAHMLNAALTAAPRKHLLIEPAATHNDLPMATILSALDTLLAR